MKKPRKSTTPKSDLYALKMNEMDATIPEAVATMDAICEMKCQHCNTGFRYYLSQLSFWRDAPWLLAGCQCTTRHVWFYVID